MTTDRRDYTAVGLCNLLEHALCQFRLGSHERWVDVRCSASVVAVRVMIPVGLHDQRTLLAARVATHVAF
jgi:hypothetical protein